MYRSKARKELHDRKAYMQVCMCREQYKELCRYNTGGFPEEWSLKVFNINEKCSGTTGEEFVK